MVRNYFQKGNQNFRDKILAFDFTLTLLILLVGIISLFAMYSSERGNFSYYTQSHLYRFSIFFLLSVIFSSLFGLAIIVDAKNRKNIICLVFICLVDTWGVSLLVDSWGLSLWYKELKKFPMVLINFET